MLLIELFYEKIESINIKSKKAIQKKRNQKAYR